MTKTKTFRIIIPVLSPMLLSFVALFGLKLTILPQLGWVWVFMPIWLPYAIVALFIALLLGGFATLFVAFMAVLILDYVLNRRYQ